MLPFFRVRRPVAINVVRVYLFDTSMFIRWPGAHAIAPFNDDWNVIVSRQSSFDEVLLKIYKQVSGVKHVHGPTFLLRRQPCEFGENNTVIFVQIQGSHEGALRVVEINTC